MSMAEYVKADPPNNRKSRRLTKTRKRIWKAAVCVEALKIKTRRFPSVLSFWLLVEYLCSVLRCNNYTSFVTLRTLWLASFEGCA